MKEIYKNRTKCTGCGACKSNCPVSAISMIEDKEGFLYPVIDNNLCINCGKCIRSCPTYEKQNGLIKRDIYSYSNPNHDVLISSSSGGAFTYICDKIINMKGYICGPLFIDRQLRHVITNDLDKIRQMRGSKYLQSNVTDCLAEVKQILEQKEIVLFSGTPCQVVGLKRYLNKEYENLFTIDNVCHSIPSPLIFWKYIESIEKKNNDIFQNINFRDKDEGWENYKLRIKFKNSELISPHKGNLYMEGFLDGLYIRPSCTNCLVKEYTGYYSDITLGDYWGINDINPAHYNKNGVSAVIVNSDKGLKIISSCNQFQKEDFSKFIKINTAYYKCAKASEKENIFWYYFKNKGLAIAYKKIYNKPIIIRIKIAIKKILNTLKSI